MTESQQPPNEDALPSTPANTGHFLVIGLGHIGSRIVGLLHRLGHKVIVITDKSREDWLENARRAGAEVIVGDGRTPGILERAGLLTAQALVVVTNHDLINLEITLDARRARPDIPIVARFFDQNLGKHLETSLNLRRTLAVSALAAPVFAAAALGNEVMGSFQLGNDLMLIALHRGSPLEKTSTASNDSTLSTESRWVQAGVALLNAPWSNHRQDDSTDSTEHNEVVVVANKQNFERLQGVAVDQLEPVTSRIKEAFTIAIEALRKTPTSLRTVGAILFVLISASVLVFQQGMNLSLIDAVYFIITTVTTTGYGDISPKDSSWMLKLYACLVMMLGSASTAVLYSFVTDFVIAERFKGVLGNQHEKERGHAVLVGLGNLGVRVAGELKRAKVPCIVIDHRPDGDFTEAAKTEGRFVSGDGRIFTTLKEAGVAHARSVIATTGDDAVNLGVALEAKEHHPKVRTVVRMYDAEFAKKVQQGMKLDAALSASALAAPVFVGAALYEGACAAIEHKGELVTLVERSADTTWQDSTVAQIEKEHDFRVLFYRPLNSESFEPAQQDTRLSANDRVLVAVRDRLE